MKRHAGLVPLSREHHHGLVLAEHLVRGSAINPRADWPAARTEQAQRLLDFFRTDLGRHFELEEAHVLPEAARCLKGGGRLVQQLVDDHDAMRAMVRDLAAGLAGPAPPADLDDRLRAFGERLRRHIRIEERELFERLQTECSPDVLRGIGARLAEDEAARGASCRR